MKMFRKVTFAAAAVAMFVAAPAFAASPVVGTWATEAKSDFGTFKSTWTVAEAGGGYTVNVADVPQEGGPGAGGPPPTSTISDVHVEGSTLSFKRVLVIGDMTINLTYTVTVDGSAMTGTTHSDFGDIPITGTRS
jgi:hypothetical protein